MEFRTGIDMISKGNHLFSFVRDATVTEKKSAVFEELMTFQKKVFLICLGFSRNTADAQDLTQEVYLKAYRNIETLKEAKLSKLWLFRITRNTCLDFKKKHRLNRDSFFESDREPVEPRTPESQMIFQEQLRAIKVAIQQLPKKQREVFVLRKYGDLSYQEIAETLKIKEGTAKSRFGRARQAIISYMKGEENEKK